MTVLLGHDEAVADWVGRQTGKPFHPPFSAIGVIDRNGTLTGGYVFTGFNGDGIELSLAGKGTFTREGWRAVLTYVFGQLGCVRLQMHTSVKNRPVCRYLTRFLGKHAFEGRSRRFYGREDAACFSLIADDLSAFRAKWRL